MIFQLKGADFSANNIGKIEISLPMQEETEKILSYYAQTPTDAVKNALNVFVIKAKNMGVFENLNCLILPFLGATIEEMSINAITGISMTNYDQLAVDNKGICLKEDSSATPTITDLTILRQNNYHCSCYNTKVLQINSSQDQCVIGAYATYTYSRTLDRPGSQAMGIVFTDDVNIQIENKNSSVWDKPQAWTVSTDNTTNSINAILGEDVVTKFGTSGSTLKDDLLPTTCNFSCYTNNTRMPNYQPMGFISIGQGMTKEKALQWNNIISELMTTVLQ